MLAALVAVALAEPVVSGSGAWQYRYRADKLQLPSAAAATLYNGNGHGLCKDLAGNIYFTFDPAGHVDADTRVLARFAPDGSEVTMLGTPGPQGLARGTPHGLRIEHDAVAGKSFLYHANNDAIVFKTTLDGEILWAANFSHWAAEKPEFWPFKPTDALVVPGTDELLVADGYGRSFVHKLNKTTGAYLEGRSFGGQGASAGDPVRLHTPHGMNLDPRFPGTVVISDRSNYRLVWVDFAGHYLNSTSLNTNHAGLAMPCNVDVREDASAGEVAVVPSLGTGLKDLAGAGVGIYGPSQELLSVIEVARELGHLGHQHPHDAIFLPSGDVVVCCWAGPSNPGQGPARGTISYWERLPTELYA